MAVQSWSMRWAVLLVLAIGGGWCACSRRVTLAAAGVEGPPPRRTRLQSAASGTSLTC